MMPSGSSVASSTGRETAASRTRADGERDRGDDPAHQRKQPDPRLRLIHLKVGDSPHNFGDSEAADTTPAIRRVPVGCRHDARNMRGTVTEAATSQLPLTEVGRQQPRKRRPLPSATSSLVAAQRLSARTNAGSGVVIAQHP